MKYSTINAPLYDVFKPGDLQIMNNNTVFHSRTAYEDYADADKKRLLYRYGLLNVPRLPKSWNEFYGEIGANMVRGGIKGHHFDEQCKKFDDDHARKLKMSLDN